MTTEGLLQLVRSLPLLRSLDVCHNSRVNDDFMGGLLQAGRLEHFEVSSSCWMLLLLQASKNEGDVEVASGSVTTREELAMERIILWLRKGVPTTCPFWSEQAVAA